MIELDPLRDARLYTLLHRGNRGDVDFYVRSCTDAHRVLELGCGAGRITCPIASTAAYVVGLDIDTGMLALARHTLEASRLPARLVRADMRQFAFDATFDRIIVPYNGLFALDGEIGIVRCFLAARRHAALHTHLLFDVYAATDFEDDAGDETAAGLASIDVDDFHFTVSVHADDRRIDVFERETQPTRSHVDIDYQFHIHAADADDPDAPPLTVVQQTIAHHFVTTDDIATVLAAGGWALDAIWGGFDGEPFDDDSARMVIRARPIQVRAAPR